MKIIVHCHGFIGDILFASSVAEKLKQKWPDSYVYYDIPLPQPKLLLEANPFIDEVVVGGPHINGMHFYIPTVDQNYPATIQMQAQCGIDDQSLAFDVYMPEEFDTTAKLELEKIRQHSLGRQIFVAYQVDWAWKAYQCTPESLAAGEGAPHREMDAVIARLNWDVFLVPVGYDRNTPSSHPDARDPVKYAETAAIIKNCDWFIGAEGGLSNLAAAVGTRCIITTDFIYQNYGPNGRVRKCENPQMGPAVYYPNAGHVHLDPCIPDEEIASQIKKIIYEEAR